MFQIKIFERTEFGKIRMVMIDETPYFVGKDVAKALGYSNARDALSKHVDREDKGVAKCDTLGGKQELAVINESGLYALVFGSKLNSAKKFKHWVTSEILPSIRKHGMYAEDDLLDNPDLLLKVVMKLKMEREAKELAEQKAQELERELDQNKDWYSIKRVAALNRVDWRTFDWRKLKSTGQGMGCEVKKIFDANYGEVNTYHRDVWEKVYPEYEL